ncbi:hypothetical protein BpHYR1_003187 [Brachionus plicatilis]|uniref:Uncharacterized protein n=1 Tax=Brachionus plicatilis TaxID=10195 RepID=A0A3M7RPQ8_BRAPC|nr:hypothetical protein BpHYR1_003187 [Brachionus plicatilis]
MWTTGYGKRPWLYCRSVMLLHVLGKSKKTSAMFVLGYLEKNFEKRLLWNTTKSPIVLIKFSSVSLSNSNSFG